MNRKTLLFYSRSELTYLYGSLHEYLKDDFEIVHVAYAREEADILKNQFGIENVIVFKELAAGFTAEKITAERLEEMDQLLMSQSDGNFNLNSALQSNRTSRYIGYEKSLSVALMYYETWNRIFAGRKIDFFIHEPVSLLMNQVAAAVCRRQGGIYSTHILVQGDKDPYNFIMVDQYNGLPVEVSYRYAHLDSAAIQRATPRVQAFLDKFRSSYNVFFSALGAGTAGFKFRNDLRKAVLRQKLKARFRPAHFDPILDNIELFITEDNLNERRLRNVKAYGDIVYDQPAAEDTFYFYPLHLEPEAVVLYWADGLYTNQVKLIENIAAQLPAGVLLYVKDHPHLYGYRDRADYERIQSIPNVKLLAPSIPGKQIIKDCKGVITINGTGGLEALLMNKHVVTFGSAFYNACERVKQVRDIRDLREALYALKDVVYQDNEELYRFVLALLTSEKTGFTDFYGGMHRALKTDLRENAATVAAGLKEFFNHYGNFKSANQEEVQ
ncbi:hypothetical protein [Taibaiella chishuiensis]|uniref:Capsular polysaccharide biosynthesis protein n=1 Tax=Taibaiella chishuiensis TaxID=1434707 RepID=A0A2P8DB58_9BACT|nr:hypothetical protein [Taibaiella chishuiensis]PSK94452.1 capsular polysaccharide biosynthesis protein [Taibaiella chishuiensis]